jgi:hypothetical protein
VLKRRAIRGTKIYLKQRGGLRIRWLVQVLDLGILNSSAYYQDEREEPGHSDAWRSLVVSLSFAKNMQSREFMRAASIAGFILVALGIASLLYCVSPILLLVHAAEQRQTSLVLPILGGVALICGIALLFATRPRS